MLIFYLHGKRRKKRLSQGTKKPQKLSGILLYPMNGCINLYFNTYDDGTK